MLAAHRATSCSKTRLRIDRIRRLASAGPVPAARTMVSLMPSMSCGLTRNAGLRQVSEPL